MSFAVEGAVVAITGAARGIGKGTAKAFIDAGARVAIGDLDGALAESTASELGGETVGLALDVTSRESVEAFIAEVERRLGPIDVYVNNAGIMPTGPFLEESDAIAERQFAVNVFGTLYGLKAVLPGMLERGRGHIVNVASAAGKVSFPGVVTYTGTKHAVVGITEGLRAETTKTPVNFSLVMPGGVNTELTAGIREDQRDSMVQPEHVGAAIVDAVKTQRFEVFVPEAMGALSQHLASLTPEQRDEFIRERGLDREILDADPVGRAAYRERIEAPVAAPIANGGRR